MTSYSVAIVGATGLVGSTLLSLLEERAFPIKKLYLLASQQSVGKECSFRNKLYRVEDLAQFDFQQTELCFFCVGSDISSEYAPKAAACGNVVIDKSSYFRYHDDVPLVIPEVNAAAIADYRKKNIIANPNCSMTPVAVALKPIYDEVGIQRINLATYQSVSGNGKEAVAELIEQTAQLLNNQPIRPKVYAQQIAFNVLPHVDAFQENGYTLEEMKIIWELRKVFHDQTMAINPTAVRVPVFCGHAASIHLETKKKITAGQAMQLFNKAAGIKLITGKYPYATPAYDAAGKDFVYVGRVREDVSHDKGLNLWVVTDNLRKGAALNAIQIAEHLITHYLS